jgi:NNP family nitrate/nitrite transporter-like MFS transporter
MAALIEKWNVEDSNFWESAGKKIAWKTLSVTTLALLFSFATWFMMSVIVVKLPGIGFKFTTNQLFWLAALPGLAGGTLRILHTFLLPLYGTRNIVVVSTIIKLLPCIGIGLAVMDPSTPYWVFMVLALTAGFGGGDFSSYMPSTSLFFPKRLQGTALGIQAGIGNFGVSLAQFITPILIGFSIFGASEILTSVNPKTGEINGTSEIYLQNAAFWYIPILVIIAVVAWFTLKRIPIKASFKEQLDIFKNKHTWFCTITYLMTFGTFSGLSAAFPLMIKSLYGGFENAPDPLAYAFYGPLIGSASRILFGFIADKTGGAILTTLTGLGLAAGCIMLVTLGLVAPTGMEQFQLFVTVILSLFFFTGMGNAATFRQFPIIFGKNPRQAAGVIGWTAAIAAYGPFIFATIIGAIISASGNARTFFAGLFTFILIATALNWYYYNRKGCEAPS